MVISIKRRVSSVKKGVYMMNDKDEIVPMGFLFPEKRPAGDSEAAGQQHNGWQAIECENGA
jgi:hypothetical protein